MAFPALCFAFLLLALICGAAPVTAQDLDLRLPRVVVAAGSYEFRQEGGIEKFNDSVEIPPEYFTHPLSMVCTNGSESSPGFYWIRMFMLPKQSDADLQNLQEPVGRLLVDENTFLSSAQVYKDMTGQFTAGRNILRVEGSGRPGAIFNWEIRSIGKPRLFMPPSISTMPGAELELNGAGFSLRPNENTVMLGSSRLPVARSNFSTLLLMVPKDFPPGTYDLEVALREYRSQKISVQVIKPRSN